jgi:hypothetical protein
VRPSLGTCICRYCRCTEAKPCRLSDGEGCGWLDGLRTVCTKAACVRAYHRDWRELRARWTRRPSPFEIRERQRLEKNRKQREYRARVKQRKAQRGAA